MKLMSQPEARTRRSSGKTKNGRKSHSERRLARVGGPKFLSSGVKVPGHYNRIFNLSHPAWCKNQRRIAKYRLGLKITACRGSFVALRTRFIRTTTAMDPPETEMKGGDGAQQPCIYAYRVFKTLEGTYPARVVIGWRTFLGRLAEGQCLVCGGHPFDGIGCHLRHLEKQFSRVSEYCTEYLLPLVENCGDDKETILYAIASLRGCVSYAQRLRLAIAVEWLSYFVFWTPGISKALTHVNLGLDVFNVGLVLAGCPSSFHYSKRTFLVDVATWFSGGRIAALMSLFHVPWDAHRFPYPDAKFARLLGFLSKLTGMSKVEVTFRILREISEECGWLENMIFECQAMDRQGVMWCHRMHTAAPWLDRMRQFIPDLPSVARGQVSGRHYIKVDRTRIELEGQYRSDGYGGLIPVPFIYDYVLPKWVSYLAD
jgi:hypothetical protein